MEARFVEEVEKRDVLYNFANPGYSRKDVTEQAWSAIGNIFNLTVGECKDKWKNIRNAFVRNLKPPKSGGKVKKPYYLNDVLQFILPYIKPISSTTGNVPSIPSEDVTDPTAQDELGDIDDASIPPSCEAPAQSSPLCSLPLPSPPTEIPHFPQTQSPSSKPVATQDQTSTSNFSQQSGPACEPLHKTKCARKNPRRTRSQEEVDVTMRENFEAKKAKLEASSPANQRVEGIKMFLLSLIPDLTKLSDVQLRKFKRKTLEVIDEISAEVPEALVPLSSLRYHSQITSQPNIKAMSSSSYSASSGSTGHSECSLLPPLQSQYSPGENQQCSTDELNNYLAFNNM